MGSMAKICLSAWDRGGGVFIIKDDDTMIVFHLLAHKYGVNGKQTCLRGWDGGLWGVPQKSLISHKN